MNYVFSSQDLSVSLKICPDYQNKNKSLRADKLCLLIALNAIFTKFPSPTDKQIGFNGACASSADLST
jgi:hypothetical protein